jgi:hypothetical protein|tara:strand:- start:291 stop:719 length:429 start_codon:yes stop_codon:yes gene_type:complete
MSKNKKIGWQKYEDVLESQLHSPFVQEVMLQLQEQEQAIIRDLIETGDYEAMEQDYTEAVPVQSSAVQISEELIKEAAVLANFDCWIGHSNFDITESIKDKLEKTSGVEVLKIQSRYRFFIGVGRMFEFQDVRKNIEKTLLD